MDQEHQPILSTQLPTRLRAKHEVAVLAALGGPIVITQILQMATVVLDVVMSGRASAVDLAGVSVGASLWVPVFLFSLGLLMALTPIVAHANGARRYEQIAPAVFQSFWIALVVMTLTVFILRNTEAILVLMNVNKEIKPVALGYLHAISFGMPAIIAYNVLRFYADGLSMTRPAMVTSIVGLLVNAPLNYVLIYGKFGFPELGGVGCGWASAVALWVSFLFMAGYVFFVKNFRKTWLFQRFYAPDWPQIKELLKLGLPIGFMYLVESSVFSVIALFLSAYGAQVVASHQIALNVASLVFMVPLSVSLATSIRVGFLLGANQPVAARFSSYTGVGLTFAYGAASGLGLWYFADFITALYTPAAAVQAIAAELLTFAAVFQLADAIQVTSVGALRGYKDTKVPMLIMIISFWVFSLPLGYALGMTDWFGHSWKAKGFWTGLLVGLTLAAILISIRLHKISQKALQST